MEIGWYRLRENGFFFSKWKENLIDEKKLLYVLIWNKFIVIELLILIKVGLRYKVRDKSVVKIL